MLSSSCSDSLLSCTKERRFSSSGRFPVAMENKNWLLRELNSAHAKVEYLPATNSPK